MLGILKCTRDNHLFDIEPARQFQKLKGLEDIQWVPVTFLDPVTTSLTQTISSVCYIKCVVECMINLDQ